MLVRLLLLVACLGVAVPTLSQVGHPAKGSWAGFFGPDATSMERIRLLIDAHNGELSGTVNPGRRGVDASRVELDAPSWTLTIEAPMPQGRLVMQGTLENLGSWSARKYSGTYTMGDEMGTFSITLQ